MPIFTDDEKQMLLFAAELAVEHIDNASSDAFSSKEMEDLENAVSKIELL